MFLSCILSLSLGLALSPIAALAQTTSPSASPKITMATCGKPVCTWNAFGPNIYTRQPGQPQTVSNTFSVLNPNTQFTLHVDSDGVSSAIISVNGVQVFGPSDFNPNVTSLDRPVTLVTTNMLEIQLRSKPGTSLTITVIGVDNAPPSISESDTPAANTFGWNNTNVNVSFACSDATSGIASCPSPVLLTTEGLNQLATGTAFDLAGNGATASIQISIDKTPPTILPTQNPPPNSFGWNNSPVTVNFLCNDNLSGIQFCTPPISVSTQGQNQTIIGMAADFAGNSATTSTAVSIDETPPVVSINPPANAATVTAASLQVTGSVSDDLSGVAAVSCNSTAAVLSSSLFSCTVALLAGANTIQVQATDKAGNTASSQITVTFNATMPRPPKSLLIAPSLVNMLVGSMRPVTLIGDIGQPISGATWSVSDPTIVNITATDPPQLMSLAQGTATLTATFNGLTATMTVNVLPGTAVPPGTPLWAFDPLPGNTIMQMVPGNPVNSGDPDLYSVEAPDTLRAFTKDGLQLWAVLPGSSSATTAFASGVSGTQQQNALISVAQPVPNPLAGASAAIPAPLQDLLRKHGAFDSLDLSLRQQRFIDQHRRRLQPMNTRFSSLNASPLAASLSTSDASTNSTTMLIKSVPDNAGGIINLVETFSGCCQITQASLIKIDNSTQQQVWRHDFASAIDDSFAIGADNTIYSSQLIFTGSTNLFFGSSSNSLIFALDGNTGQAKFSLQLPPGHIGVTVTNPRFNPSSTLVADLDVAAQPGPLSILPDGSINAVVYTNHLTETFNSFILASSNETAVSDHKTLQLLTIQPDGSFATQPIQAFDFDASACAAGCKDPGAGYVPNEVVPDGQGGLLATWTGNDSQLGITSSSAALARHFDNAGGTLDYVVPFASSSWFRIGGDNAQALVVNENGTAFATDGQSLIAFDVNTGSQQWSFQPAGFQGIALLAASDQGGVAAVQLADFQGEIDATPEALLAFDPTGALTPAPFLAGNAQVGYFASNALLAVAGFGQGEMVNASAALDPQAAWDTAGNLLIQRAASLVPTYFVPLGADILLSATACPDFGQFGTGLDVHYQVFDQYAHPFARAGITPLEQVTQNGVIRVRFAKFSTPETTESNGKFDDTPIAECAGPPLPPRGVQVCKSAQQQFEVDYHRATYKIVTNTALQQCILGTRVQVFGNPPGLNADFQIGNFK